MLDVFCHCPLSFLRQGPLLNVELTYWLDWLVNKPPGFFLSLNARTGITRSMLLCLGFCVIAGIQTQVLVLKQQALHPVSHHLTP